MKNIKMSVLLVALFVFGLTTTNAQKPENFDKLVVKNIVSSLNNDINGVVEATIYNSIFLVKYYPEANVNEVLDELNDLAVNSNVPVIKYKAQLAALYLSNYETSDLDLAAFKGDQAKLFRHISEMLESNLLASN